MPGVNDATQRKPQSNPPFRLATGLVIALVLVAVGLMHLHLWLSHDDERGAAIQSTEQRAAQLVIAVADRMNVLVRSADFMLQELRADYGAGEATFSELAGSLMSTFPDHSLQNYAITDARGNVLFSSAASTGSINLSDREYFISHRNGGDRLIISKPLEVGRISKTWVVLFSRPILRAGRFAGVVVLGLSPQSMSSVLTMLELASKDSIALTDSNGTFVARNRDLDVVLGKTLAPARPFMQPEAAPRGIYRVPSFDDGSDRIFAWQRVGDSKLVALVGLDVNTVLAPLEARFRREWINAGVLSVLLAGLGVAVLALLSRLSRRQRELATSEARFRSLTGLSADWYWEQDADMRFIAIEGAQRGRGGLDATDHVGKTRWDLPALNMTPADWDRHKAQLDARMPFHDLELRRNDSSDGEVWISTSGEPLFDGNGAFVGYRGVGRDISERKRADHERQRLETQLRQMHKMEALGTLAGGIAHDFNNLLAAIFGNVERARQDAGAQSPVQHSLVEIAAAAERARDLVRQILTFSRHQPLERRVVSLGDVVQDAVKLLRAGLPMGVDLVVNLAPDAPNVLADRVQLHQVLMNLGANAWQAMAGRQGRIEIALAGVTVAAAGGVPPPGRYARLSVIDSGIGMDSATRERIFDPFFTTKPAGEGTGLGLAVVDGIVQGHGGVIKVDSHPGRGSAFHLYFPAAQGSAESAATPPPSAPRAGSGQRILFLDDEKALVMIAKAMLERLGYQVHGFTIAEQALAAFKTDPSAFDLLVTDYNMPGASGLDVAREMRRLRPDLPIALASGFVTDELRAQALALGIRELIYKPQTIEELASAVARALAQRPR
jgi:PAS domain S-box-containing protein